MVSEQRMMRQFVYARWNWIEVCRCLPLIQVSRGCSRHLQPSIVIEYLPLHAVLSADSDA